MNDEQIIELYWQRNEDAIRETSAKYGSYCLAVANNILASREDAEECVGDTWLSAWNAIPPHRPSRLRAFLAKLTRDLSLNKFKSRAALRRGGGELPLVLDELAECVAGSSDVEEVFLAAELEASIVSLQVSSTPRKARQGNKSDK